MELKTREDAAREGMKRFFDGTKCKRGHVAERFVSSGGCVDCTAVHNRKSRRKIKRLISEARAARQLEATANE